MESAKPKAGIDQVVDLTDPDDNIIYNMSYAEAITALRTGKADRLNSIDGHFGLVVSDGSTIRMARTLSVIRRYFIAQIEGRNRFVFSDRIDKIRNFCLEHRIEEQFDPYYTRMIPAHHIVELDLSSDCEARYESFLPGSVSPLPTDIGSIGREYILSVYGEMLKWLRHSVPANDMVGVMWSGGIDSTAILLLLMQAFQELGRDKKNIKAFTLSVDGGGTDFQQARQVVEVSGLHSMWEVVPLSSDRLSVEDAVRSLEDYHPLDVQCAMVCSHHAAGIRDRYPALKYLVNGDGNDENLKSYPLEDSHLTLEEVLSIPLIYQEGWGIHHLKHSMTFSGGLSRSYVRSYSVDHRFNFKSVSHFTAKPVVQIASRIPFRELVHGSEDRLYSLKGEITKAGVKHVTGKDMIVFPKARFQQGAMSSDVVRKRMTFAKTECKMVFNKLFGLTKSP